MTFVTLHLAASPASTILVNLAHVQTIRRVGADVTLGLPEHTRLVFVAPTHRVAGDATLAVVERPERILELASLTGLVPLR